MTLELKNIGMIKEANVKIDGLTVIAGENDTGKSTVGKALHAILKVLVNMKNKKIYSLSDEKDEKKIFGESINIIYFILFKKYLIESHLSLTDNNFNVSITNDSNKNNTDETSHHIIELDIEKFPYIETVFIETPLIWNFSDFFRDMAQIESQMNIKIDYPALMKDLNFKLFIKSASSGLDIKEKVTKLMGGEFKKDEMGRYYFDKKGQKIDLLNTASGIKYFGIFQVLSQNNYLNENTVLILDEPEVHLHPKWQLEMAKIIVELVKNGVKIVVNSHSPYMIEALKRYSEVEKIEDKTNFYLAENGYIEHQDSLENIFEKLALPMRELKKLKMDRYLND